MDNCNTNCLIQDFFLNRFPETLNIDLIQKEMKILLKATIFFKVHIFK